MFDIAFSEVVVIAVVALVVIGPERLPKVARTLGFLMGRFNRYVNTVKSDIEREMRMDELKKFQQQVEQGAQQAGQMIVEETRKVEEGANQVASSLNDAGQSVMQGDAPPAEPVKELVSPDSSPNPTPKSTQTS